MLIVHNCYSRWEQLKITIFLLFIFGEISFYSVASFQKVPKMTVISSVCSQRLQDTNQVASDWILSAYALHRNSKYRRSHRQLSATPNSHCFTLQEHGFHAGFISKLGKSETVRRCKLKDNSLQISRSGNRVERGNTFKCIELSRDRFAPLLFLSSSFPDLIHRRASFAYRCSEN